ncbi:Cyclic beta-1,2-glucan synthase [Thermobrachium celere DSM 8682]|uniref:Cyclic beta-1,2-glucan synthase n=1 Tax=Thermobrachium celere DSM 8682 TaxID=941824 RepID=R7RSZ6_9CLOT|nr:Cyclic beta-1,2-glucan synthase [Thermobrachium celere DSM 8682]
MALHLNTNHPFSIKGGTLSADELSRHAIDIAKEHKVSTNYNTILLNRLNNNFESITDIYKFFHEKHNQNTPLCPASEWLLDNYYIIEEQHKILLNQLDKSFFKQLLYLKNSIFKDLPRIFAVCYELVSHSDGRIDRDNLINFIESYQKVTPLTMQELWSLEPMLKISLLEYISSICLKIYNIQNIWDKVFEFNNLTTDEIIDNVSEHLKNMESIDYHFLERVLIYTKKTSQPTEKILEIINDKLFEYNITIDEVLHHEHQEQAKLQIAIGNAITSLRFVISLNFEDLFEELSYVEKILRQDPSEFYIKQDFESRSYYRQKIMEISKKYNIAETYVAKTALECCEGEKLSLKQKHIGYYLVDEGIDELLSRLNVNKKVKRHTLFTYLMPIFSLTILISSLYLKFAYNISPIGLENIYMILVLISVLPPALNISINLVNRFILNNTKPSFLPKLDFSEGIPSDCKTIVIVPTLIPNTKRVKELIKNLEITYVSNNSDNIYFVLLGDLKDSDKEIEDNDKDIIDTAVKLINELNEKYQDNKFYFLCRKRVYNESQQRYMGYERKRGAICEFNRLIRGYKDTTFNVIVGDIEKLLDAKYVITLDADTKLPISTAAKLIGTIAHPLNRAIIDHDLKVVVEGYGLIQPRIGIDIESSTKSKFTRIYASEGGIDTYSGAISDVYMDLFKEGIFTGKGIYDVDAFLQTLDTAIPDNTLLSHDLIEGSYLRVGLATDIELIDGFPQKYNSYIQRMHRWIRGDWQTIIWLNRFIKNAYGEKVLNPINSVSKWKIFDNLRRSLLPINYSILVILSLYLFNLKSIYLIMLLLIDIFLPVVFNSIDYFKLKYYKVRNRRLNNNIIYGFKNIFYQSILTVIFLPHLAHISLDAITKTIYRVYVSHKNLLEWVTAADVEKNTKNDLRSYVKLMVPSASVLSILALLSILLNKYNYIYALPLVIIWISSPLWAYKLSQPEIKTLYQPSDEDIKLIRNIAIKTWKFYEDIFNEENNYLPVDNIQEVPTLKIAHRTSPTNIGFLILSMCCAVDLGYITLKKFADMLNKTLSTIEKLDKWNGHLYNWYDTRTLQVLHPKYISTVDSGNLVAYLMVTSSTIEDYLNKKPIEYNFKDGIRDILSYYEIDNEVPDKDDLFELINELNPKLNSDKTKSILNDLNEYIKIYPNLINTSKLEFLNQKNEYQKLRTLIDEIKETKLKELPSLYREISNEINSLKNKISNIEYEILKLLDDELNLCNHEASNLINKLYNLKIRLDSFVKNTKFAPLYDKKRGLFSIGFDVDNNKLTNSYYDLLASEARIASYLAVINREVPVNHWFKLGRSLSEVDGYLSLVSWTGTMFEYFMPAIIMKNYAHSLIDETYKTVIRAQINYGRDRKVPWGTSESGFYGFDILLNFQYKAFGVPALGLKRGLSKDMVISPYSTLLVLPFKPRVAIENIKELIKYNLIGKYGFYEAIDFTPDRTHKDLNYGIVQSFMAHHQGMILTSINNYINRNILIERFHSNPNVIAGEFLLQEKIPVRTIITKNIKEDIRPLEKPQFIHVDFSKKLGLPKDLIPNCHLITNGDLSAMYTDYGCNYLKYKDIYINRWRDNITDKKYGSFIFIRDVNDNLIWSNTLEPTSILPEKYEVTFNDDKIKIFRSDNKIETTTEVCISAEDNCKIEKLVISNLSESEKTLEITSYMEITLSSLMADIAHPTFNNLFIRTEFVEKYNSIIASRRPREHGKKTIWAFHTLCTEQFSDNIEIETDRYKFIGRGNNLLNPKALTSPLTNTTGAVLDPIFSIRKRITLKPNSSITLAYVTGIAETKEQCIELCQKYSEFYNIDRSFSSAYLRAQMEDKYLSLTLNDKEIFSKILNHVVFTTSIRRKYKEKIENNIKGQSSLWAYGISGDIPIMLVKISKSDYMDIVETMIKCHEYYRVRGLLTDLVILVKEEGGYLQPLQSQIRDLVRFNNNLDQLDRFGGIFIRSMNNMPCEDVNLLYAVAKIVIDADLGNIQKQLSIEEEQFDLVELKTTNKIFEYKDVDLFNENLEIFNGYGGFAKGGREYIIKLIDNMLTPLPWINVVANNRFGFIATESGGGYTFSENSRENKLTPWSNDPVIDHIYETIFIRDDDTGEYFTITPRPVRHQSQYTITYGTGYVKYIHQHNGIFGEITSFVPKDDMIKVSLLKIKNNSNSVRRLSLFYYVKPVMGVTPYLTNQYIVNEFNDNINSFIIKNSYNTDFPNRLMFISSSEKIISYTGNLNEFLKDENKINSPEGLKYETLSNTVGAGLNPCSVVQIKFEIKEDEEKHVSLLMGSCLNFEDLNNIVKRYRDINFCYQKLDEATMMWHNLLDTIKINTPNKPFNILMNTWLLYQTLCCRIWARSAFYQSGGAYGFRDQLQDVLSFINIKPEIAKTQILLHCAHQFVEGDVQHWWHPGSHDKGIRTKFSDDLLWLPYVTAEYIVKTGDYDILDIEVNYLEDEPLDEETDERYGIPKTSNIKGSVYEHCIKAIDRALKYGEHGIPLMGSGDWNDGMNTVGNKGKGESVWLGWFLIDILNRFIPICEKLNDIERANIYKEHMQRIINSIEQNAWDGEWYRRAYFDDGTPLGSSLNQECKIDSLAQSWSLISNAGDKDRAVKAMDAVEKYLISYDDGIIKLFTPAFDKSDLNPGYIKGYVPGVRENGGQYTHAATWVILAYTKLGLGDKAFKLFDMINPINHTNTQLECAKYKVEPYVMAADVYAVEPHVGRGGWTWYTGSSGWMYKVGLEGILGFNKLHDRIIINPCIPKTWPEYDMVYTLNETVYNIKVINKNSKCTGVEKIELDGNILNQNYIPVLNDKKTHNITVYM